MSANVNVNVKLTDRIPDVSQLTDFAGQIKSEIEKVEVPGMPLDKIRQLTGGFNIELPDTSAWSGVIPADVAGLLENFPDPSALAKPLGEPLEQISRIFSLDFAGELSRVEERLGSLKAPSLDDPRAFLDGLIAPLPELSRLLKESEITKLITMIGELIGADDLEKLPENLAAFVTQIQTFLQEKVESLLLAFVSLGSIGTGTEKTERLVQAITDSFSLESTNARYQALLQQYGEGEGGLAGQIRGLDFSDAAQVAAARDRLRTTNEAFGAFYLGLVRDMAFSEASLAVLNIDVLQGSFNQIGETLSVLDAEQLKSLAGGLKGLLEKVKTSIRFDDDMSIGKFKSLIKDGLMKVQAELERFDPGKIQESLDNVLSTINEPFKKLEEFKLEVESIVRGAFQSVQEAIKKIDLTPLRNGFDQAMGQVETRLTDLDGLFTEIRETIGDALNQVKAALQGVKDFILDPENGLKKKIEDLFDSVFRIFDELNLKGIVDGISQTLQPVSVSLEKIEFAPIIDATVDAIETISSVLKKVVPLLVTDDLKQKLAEATEFLKKIDFDEISRALDETFDEILNSIDEDALGAFKQEYQKVIDAIDRFDPTPILQDLQQEVFDPLIAEMEKVKPAELLQPIQEGYEAASKALKGFDPAETFAFITEFFDELLTKFHELSPAKLLEPIEKALNDIREKINSVLRIDDMLDGLDRFTGFFQPIVEKLELGSLLDELAAGHAEMKAALSSFDPASLTAPIAAMLRNIFSPAGMDVDVTGVKSAFEIITSKTAALSQRFSALRQKLEQGRAILDQLDVNGYLSELRTRQGEVRAALASHSGSSAAKLELGILVESLDPVPVLSPLIPKVDRVKERFASKTDEFGRAVEALSPVFDSIDAIFDALRTFLSVFDLLKSLIQEPFSRLFPDKSFSSVKESLLHFLDEMGPDQWRAELEPLVVSVQTKLKSLFGDAVLNPIAGTLSSIKATTDLLNISALSDAINGAFAEVEQTIEQFNPAPFIKAIDDIYKRILALLEKLDPSAFIAEIDSIYSDDVIGVIKAISPEELLLPVLRELFQKIKGLLVAIDIEVLFKPVLDHLKSLEEQLVEGLKRAGTAYKEMLASLGSGAGAQVSVSASVTV
ncbi:MAG: hypothetical protein L0229_09440 [Blastocatellia bacterium]|nr:hypothetical protein [Blastocatellia bacterium]